MKVLVINSGSSSLKYQLIDMQTEQVMCKGLCERIGIEGSILTHKANGSEWTLNTDIPSHAEAFEHMLKMMTEGEGAVVKDKSEIDAIGHRVVHGGEKFTASALVTDEMLAKVDELSVLAPLHNPPQVQGIRSAQKVFGGDVPQTAVFDTAFHQSMPAKAFTFAIPYEYYTNNSIRRYGFHGTSHRFVSAKAAEALGKKPEDVKIITCHLGNGSSLAAVNGGKGVDTSMGLTPLGGILMGTRCGDLDPSVATYLGELENAPGAQISDLLNKKSGLLGVSGLSSDFRDVENAAEEGNERAALVREMLAYQIKKFIGAYAAAMNGVDCVVFTGGIGENSKSLREMVCSDMQYLGVKFDGEKNQQRGEVVEISADDSAVKVLVVQTNEELMIARDTMEIVKKG